MHVMHECAFCPLDFARGQLQAACIARSTYGGQPSGDAAAHRGALRADIVKQVLLQLV